jgi:hypothetical protein
LDQSEAGAEVGRCFQDKMKLRNEFRKRRDVNLSTGRMRWREVS